jgi:hypothetical protein
VTTLHAFVISWTGQAAAAEEIAAQLAPHVERLTVIHSDNSEAALPAGWVRTPNDWFFGRKFEHCLGLFEGEVMLQVSADLLCEDWGGLATSCRAAFDNLAALGVWGPDVDSTYWDLQMTDLARITGSTAHCVTLIDSVVWAMRRAVADRLVGLDFTCNSLGWGIDRMAALFSHVSGRLVVREQGLRIVHPPGSGYDHAEANAQSDAFLRQMAPAEAVQNVLFNAVHVLHRQERDRQFAGNTSTGSTGLALSSGVGA